MIIVNEKHVIEPTMFPDGTSQVWKLPETLVKNQRDPVTVEWRFESEAELIHLFQLRALLKSEWYLHIPYLPYARQDKFIGNDETFALAPFLFLLNQLNCRHLTCVDVHNPHRVAALIGSSFTNIQVTDIHQRLIAKEKPDFIVYPDAGAYDRYPHLQDHDYIVLKKVRDPLTGEFLSHTIEDIGVEIAPVGSKALIVDDICDGGATFLSIARVLREAKIEMVLFVTHGIFSKGTKILEDAGLTLYTTNSLVKNTDGFDVCGGSAR